MMAISTQLVIPLGDADEALAAFIPQLIEKTKKKPLRTT